VFCNEIIIYFSLFRDDFDMLVSTSGNSMYHSLRDAQCPISLRNEVKAMQALLGICKDLLSKYPTSFDQDSRRLQEGDVAPFSNERHALIQIKGEKEVLLFLQDFAHSASTLLLCADYADFDACMEEIRMVKHPVIYQHASSTLCRLYQDEQRRLELRSRKVDLSRPTVV
jgi:hypothetical protein